MFRMGKRKRKDNMKKFNSLKDLSSILSDKDKKEIEKTYISKQNKQIPKIKKLGVLRLVKEAVEDDINSYKQDELRDINVKLLKDVLDRNKDNKPYDKESIHEYLTALGCKYIVYDDLSVDIIGDINIIGFRNFIPIKFKSVTRNFVVRGVSITTMKNFPKIIGGNLIVCNTLLRDLSEFPEVVNGDIDLHGNKKLLSVTFGLPSGIGNLDLSNCGISVFMPFDTIINGNINLSNNQLRTISLDCINKSSSIDLSSNFIITKLKTNISIDYSNNPCQPDDSYESAMW